MEFSFAGKKVLVCGMGKSGISAAVFLNKKGAKVTLQDIKTESAFEDLERFEKLGISLFLGHNPDRIVSGFDCMVVSPGIPSDLPYFRKAKECGVPILSEVEIGFLYTPCPVAAITGTNGKTTTTALTGEIIKKRYPKAAVLGNIGIPYTGEVDKLTENDYVVAEIGSFQLENSYSFKPHISAVLNITPDHLDRHKTMECYISMKEKIFANQDENDFLILNYDDPVCRGMSEKTRARVFFFSRAKELDEGIYLKNNNIIVKWEGAEENIINIDRLKILGTHNYENAMAASAAGICAGVGIEDIRDSLSNFSAVEHRIEFVTSICGVDYYNDSKGTNPDASIKAIEAMKRPIVLLGGGYDKHSDFTDFIKAFEGKVKELILIGETAGKIKACAEENGFKNITMAETLKEAVYCAKEKASAGDCVLLSPACASWDMFKNFEERGELFKKIVKDIKQTL